MTKTEIRINGTVWFFDPYGNLFCGRVAEIAGEHVRVKGTGDSFGTTGAKTADCYATKQECIRAKQDADRAEVEAYKAQITDVRELVKFMYDNTVSCAEEYTDWNARKAARERARELLGIDPGI